MSYEEVQFEEKSVQLIPEDLEILSEYSWNMAGYLCVESDLLHRFERRTSEEKENRIRTRVGCVAAAGRE